MDRTRVIALTLALIAAIAVPPCASSGWARGLGVLGLGLGQSAVPENLISYVRSDYSGNSDITISGGDTFNVTCVNGNYPRAEDDPAAGITTTAEDYHWVIEITAYDDANVFLSIGGTTVSNGDYGGVGTYSGDVTSGTTGYIRIGANCTGASNSVSYKVTLTAL